MNVKYFILIAILFLFFITGCEKKEVDVIDIPDLPEEPPNEILCENHIKIMVDSTYTIIIHQDFNLNNDTVGYQSFSWGKQWLTNDPDTDTLWIISGNLNRNAIWLRFPMEDNLTEVPIKRSLIGELKPYVEFRVNGDYYASFRLESQDPSLEDQEVGSFRITHINNLETEFSGTYEVWVYRFNIVYNQLGEEKIESSKDSIHLTGKFSFYKNRIPERTGSTTVYGRDLEYYQNELEFSSLFVE